MNHCVDCRFWGWPERDRGDRRACQLMSDWPYFDGDHPLGGRSSYEQGVPTLSPWAGADGAAIDTPAEFGCTLWLPKKAEVPA